MLLFQDRACLALQRAATVHKFKPFEGPMMFQTLTNSTSGGEDECVSPFKVSPSASTRLCQADYKVLEITGCLTGSISHQVIGFGRYAVST